MDITAFAALDIPFILVVYLGILLLFLRPPRAVLVASLLGGLLMGLINVLFDLFAYYAHIWHYTLNGLILHLPIPFYITPILIYGSLAYLLIARFWRGRGHWFAMLLLIGIPLFRFATDLLGAYVQGSYTPQYESWVAMPLDLIMWVIMFYAGLWVFQRLIPSGVKQGSQPAS
jgi:hypothetical protein